MLIKIENIGVIMLTISTISDKIDFIILLCTEIHQNSRKSKGRLYKFRCHGSVVCCDMGMRNEKMSENRANENCTEDDYVDLRSAAEYLISLFVETGKKYSCTRTKIGKLLSIVAFYYARRGRIVFRDEILKYKGCGTAIADLKGYVDLNVYLPSDDGDDESRITDSLSGECCINCPKDITPPIGCVIEEVFRRFGAYSARRIGDLINECISEINDNSNSIDLEHFSNVALVEGTLTSFINDNSLFSEDPA